MRQNSSTKVKARAKPRQNPNRGSPDPPQFQMQPTFHRRMRFVNEGSSDTSATVTSLDILGALGCISLGGTDGRTISSAFRVKKIEVWATPKSDSDGAWQSAYIEWKNSTSFSKSTRVMDASNSNARPLHISTSPPKLSVCDLWVHGPTVELFSLKVPTGAIVDVIVDFLIADRNEPLAVTFAFTNPPGLMIYGKLDQTSSAAIVQIDRGV